MVIVRFLGLDSFQNGLVLVRHSQHITLPPGSVQAVEKDESHFQQLAAINMKREVVLLLNVLVMCGTVLFGLALILGSS